MSYTKNTWATGDIITETKLNNIEGGLSSINQNYNQTTWANGDTITAEELNNIETGITNANVNYSFNTWANGDVITAEKLNNVEEGIYLRSADLKTVLYTDGTLIINEDPADRAANITAHGAVVEEYDPLDENHDYVFTYVYDEYEPYCSSPWWSVNNNITSVEIGSKIRPTSTANWFYDMGNCASFDLTNLDTSATTDMSSMFCLCAAVKTIDMSMFDTSSVTNMAKMFYYCSDVTNIYINNFDTSHVVSMDSMFYGCSSCTTIVASNSFVTTALDPSFDEWCNSNVFQSCNNLVGGNGTKYNGANTDATYARIDTAETPGYFTAAT